MNARSLFIKLVWWILGIAFVVLITYGIIKYNTFADSKRNKQMAEKFATEFVYAMQQENVDFAYQLLTERSKENNPIDGLRSLAKDEPFQKYESLEICLIVAGISEKSGDQYIDGKGNIYFNGDYVPFQIILIRDENDSWKINGFYLVRDRTQSLCDVLK